MIGLKRMFDACVAAVGLIVVAPVIAFASVAIRLESSGPAIFAQARVGRGRRVFTCYKLRTMRKDTAHVATHLAASSSITQLGARLRRWKLDELPQLWNVLVGDMSLVGPRPCLPSQTELVEARDRLGVYGVLPGITGLAQVQHIDMSDPGRLAQVDAEYVKTQSFTGDLRLIAATLLGSGLNVDRIRRPAD
jgi:O-antigen biosynthesis protein WbqP